MTALLLHDVRRCDGHPPGIRAGASVDVGVLDDGGVGVALVMRSGADVRNRL